MARVKIKNVIEDLSTSMRKALEAAVKEIIPDAEFDHNTLFRAFKRAVGRKCTTWEQVGDDHVELE